MMSPVSYETPRRPTGKPHREALHDSEANRIVGYSISDQMQSRLAVTALNNAVARLGDVAGSVVYCDRLSSPSSATGSSSTLNRHGMVGSMGRVDAAGDNATLANFFSCCRRTS